MKVKNNYIKKNTILIDDYARTLESLRQKVVKVYDTKQQVKQSLNLKN